MHPVTRRRARQSASIAIMALVSVRGAAQAPAPPATVPPDQAPAAGAPGSPLTIRVGDAELLFGGFIDASAIRRDTNTGSGLGTSFGTIPFGNTVQGHMNDTQFSSPYAYYSQAHATQTTAIDADGTSIGFGVPGSTAANEKITELTAGLAHTFFRDPRVGGIQLMAQYSHVRRTPFSVPAGTPADASLNMLYVNLRYFLP